MKLLKRLFKRLINDQTGANLVQISVISGLLSASMLAAIQQNQVSLRRAGRNKDIQVAGYVIERLRIVMRDQGSCTTSAAGSNPNGALNLTSAPQQVAGINDTSAYNEDYPIGNINSHLAIQAIHVHDFAASVWDPRTGDATMTVIFQKLNVPGSKGTRNFPRSIPIVAYLTAPGGNIQSCFQGSLNGPVVSFCQNFGRTGGAFPLGTTGGTFAALRCNDLVINRDNPLPGPALTINNNGLQVNGALTVDNLTVTGTAQSGSTVAVNGILRANGGMTANNTVRFPNITGVGTISGGQICFNGGGGCRSTWPPNVNACNGDQGTRGWTNPAASGCYTMRIFQPGSQSGWVGGCTGGLNVVTGVSIFGAAIKCSVVQ